MVLGNLLWYNNSKINSDTTKRNGSIESRDKRAVTFFCPSFFSSFQNIFFPKMDHGFQLCLVQHSHRSWHSLSVMMILVVSPEENSHMKNDVFSRSRLFWSHHWPLSPLISLLATFFWLHCWLLIPLISSIASLATRSTDHVIGHSLLFVS